MLELNADPNPEITSPSEYPLLYYCSKKESLPIAKLLIEKGAKLTASKSKSTVLHSQPDYEMAVFFFEHGADVNEKDPILSLASSDLVDTFNLYLEKGANLNGVNSHGESILHIILKRPVVNKEIFDMAIKRCTLGFRLVQRNGNGVTPIHLAANIL